MLQYQEDKFIRQCPPHQWPQWPPPMLRVMSLPAIRTLTEITKEFWPKVSARPGNTVGSMTSAWSVPTAGSAPAMEPPVCPLGGPTGTPGPSAGAAPGTRDVPTADAAVPVLERMGIWPSLPERLELLFET